VQAVRRSYGIESYHDWLRRQGWLTAVEMAPRLRLTRGTAKRFARDGLVRAVRADDKGIILFAPPEGPLPKGHRGKRHRDRRVFPKLDAEVRKEVQYET
jgi:hypothetical protein